MDKKEFQTTAANAGVIGISALSGAVIGFFLQLAVAYYFGASQHTDAYFMAQSTSELLSKLLLGGSIVSVFIPLFIEQLQSQGKSQAWDMALNIMHVTIGLFLVVLVAVGIFASPLIHVIAPGFDAQTSDLTIKLLRVLLPSFFFLFIVDIGTAMLQAVKHFAIPSLMRIIAPSISLLSVLVLVNSYGIYSLAIGASVGSLVQASLIIYSLGRQGFYYRFIFEPTSPTIRKLIHLVYPFIISMLVTQAAGIVYRVLVSGLPTGSLAALKFAEKITQLSTVIFLTSFISALYPLMAEKAGKKDMQGLQNSIAAATRLIFFVSLPLTIGLIWLRDPLIAFIYQRGSFSGEAAHATSLALLFLALGLVTNAISAVLGYATLAMQKTKASVAVTVASQVVAISLFMVLTPRMGHTGLALGSSLVPLSIAALYLLYLSRFMPRIWTIFWHPTYLKTVPAAAVLALTLSLASRALGGLNASIISQGIRLLVPALLGCAVYAAIAQFWNISEMRQVTSLVRKKIGFIG